MKPIQTTLAALLFTFALLPGVSCKKESTSTKQATREKIMGKWNWISEVTNDYYGGMPHIITYNFSAGDYIEFKSDGKVTEHERGTVSIYDYGVIDETRIWLIDPSNVYTLTFVTASDLQVSQKTSSAAGYYESTLHLKR